MTIYVGDLCQYPTRHGRWCHMMTDQDDLTELHEMAKQLGIRAFFRSHRLHPHYDLVASKRERAITLGAVAVSSEEMVKKCSRLFTHTLDALNPILESEGERP